ncbi:hypothetical protein [Pelolinea submarina]|uniref:Uncharacterized protein n=1 Tax=Pelolinea submarina TaxID=913107 RepID=A0A347ZWC3_9CHLR|nr:hypothetical protein [Pelolinea submarina]REG05346.1 hypothetical protein DFR64_2746 [Pelolinea submarina]BBB49604.1 hypothetical protein Pelsub_P2835 [Pelolinea submarina]
MKNPLKYAVFLTLFLTIPALIVGCREDLWSIILDTNQVDFSPVEAVDGSQPTVKVYNDPDDLLLMLHEMEKVRNSRWQSQTGWWQGRKTMIYQLGDLHGINAEWWFHFDGVQSCPDLLQTIYAEDGRLVESNLLVRANKLQTADSAGQLPDEEGRPKLVKLPDQACPDLLNQTLDRVENMLEGPNLDMLESTEAIIREGSLFITVVQTGPIHEMVNVVINLDNGFIMEETEQIYSLDDSGLLGEVTYQYQFDYFDQLPPEIRDQFERALNS